MNGVSPELIFGSNAEYSAMDHVEREAWLIALGQMQGRKWDFKAWRWTDAR